MKCTHCGSSNLGHDYTNVHCKDCSTHQVGVPPSMLGSKITDTADIKKPKTVVPVPIKKGDSEMKDTIEKLIKALTDYKEELVKADPFNQNYGTSTPSKGYTMTGGYTGGKTKVATPVKYDPTPKWKQNMRKDDEEVVKIDGKGQWSINKVDGVNNSADPNGGHHVAKEDLSKPGMGVGQSTTSGGAMASPGEGYYKDEGLSKPGSTDGAGTNIDAGKGAAASASWKAGTQNTGISQGISNLMGAFSGKSEDAEKADKIKTGFFNQGHVSSINNCKSHEEAKKLAHAAIDAQPGATPANTAKARLMVNQSKSKDHLMFGVQNHVLAHPSEGLKTIK